MGTLRCLLLVLLGLVALSTHVWAQEENSTNSPIQVSQLKEGIYKSKLVDLNEVFTEMGLPLKIDSRSFLNTPEVKLKKEPAYERMPKYATINIAEKVITIVAEKTGKSEIETHLYVDFDGDQNLTDAGERIRLDVSTDDQGHLVSSWVGELAVAYGKEMLTYRISIYFTASSAEYYLVPKKGYLVEMGSEKAPITGWLIDVNCNGNFADACDWFAVDLNQNNRFDALSGQEWTALKNPLQVGKNKYSIKINANGKEIVVKLAK